MDFILGGKEEEKEVTLKQRVGGSEERKCKFTTGIQDFGGEAVGYGGIQILDNRRVWECSGICKEWVTR